MIRFLRILFPLAVTLACLAAPAVAGANVAPNPGFESSCGLTLCDWTSVASASFTPNALSAHSGSTGADLVSTAPGHSPAVISSCVGGVTPGKTYDYSAWYRTTANIIGVSFTAAYATGPNCSTALGNPGGASTSSPIHDGQWHPITGTAIAPAGATEAVLEIELTCQGLCPVGTTVSYDDLSLDIAPTTAASIRSFTTTHSPAGTVVRWRTASEVEVAGFNLYRFHGGRKVKLNHHLIAAKGRGGAGASYRLLDRGPRGIAYRLEVVDLDGTRQWRTVR